MRVIEQNFSGYEIIRGLLYSFHNYMRIILDENNKEVDCLIVEEKFPCDNISFWS